MNLSIEDGEVYYLTLDNAIINGSLNFDRNSSQRATVHITLKGHNVINGAVMYLISHSGNALHCGIATSSATVIIHPEEGSSLVINGNDESVCICADHSLFAIDAGYPFTGSPNDKQIIIGVPGGVPAVSASSSASKTGDDANIALWLGLMAASALCALGMMRRAKKEY